MLLLLVILQSLADGIIVRKSSILALVLHGEGLQQDRREVHVYSAMEMERREKEIKTEMRGADEDWSLVRRKFRKENCP